MPLMLPAPVQRQVLDVGAERVADRGDDGVGAAVGGFGDHVAEAVDVVGVVADVGGDRHLSARRCRTLLLPARRSQPAVKL